VLVQKAGNLELLASKVKSLTSGFHSTGSTALQVFKQSSCGQATSTMPVLSKGQGERSVTQPDVPKVALGCIAFKISMIHKQICNSHYLSQFATFFIEPPTESSTPNGLYS
jgi:hypothetical protein